MKSIIKINSIPKHQGFTLVEIMIALMLGVFMTAGIGNIYIGSQQTSRLQQNLSRIQENGRFALDYLAKEIRPAGYQGCPNLSNVLPEILIDDFPSSFNLQSALRGYTYSGSSISGYTPASNVVSNTDIITVQRASGCTANVTQGLDTLDEEINVDGSCEFEEDDFLVISDCKTSDIIAASSVSDDGEGISHDASVNTSADLSKLYDTKAEVFRIYSREFYIKNNPDDNQIPYLYQREVSKVDDIATPNEEELIDGVEDMEVTYGVKIKNNTYAYLSASAITQWNQVKSVRITLLMRSMDDNLTEDPVSINFAGTTVTPTDHRIRRVFSTTVFLRNRT